MPEFSNHASWSLPMSALVTFDIEQHTEHIAHM